MIAQIMHNEHLPTSSVLYFFIRVSLWSSLPAYERPVSTGPEIIEVLYTASLAFYCTVTSYIPVEA